MNLKKFLKSILIFDEYMRIPLIMFAVLYFRGMVDNLYLLSSFMGILNYFWLLIGSPILILSFLKLVQWICRIVGLDKVYYNIKNK